mmetsp:Transcript_88992/g.247240  ORF Transcript_88992/g.247240 Transcript_88992/m.247240 type:complete len:86 (-) Transcript_88992:112-369(-)
MCVTSASLAMLVPRPSNSMTVAWSTARTAALSTTRTRSTTNTQVAAGSRVRQASEERCPGGGEDMGGALTSNEAIDLPARAWRSA